MDKIEKLREFIIQSGLKGFQTFNSRNIIGDSMATIYKQDGITVDYCHYYEYLEIFGLSKTEYRSLSDVLDIC